MGEPLGAIATERGSRLRFRLRLRSGRRFAERRWTTRINHRVSRPRSGRWLSAPGATIPRKSRRRWRRLCQAYWYPLYSFIRRRGYPSHDAQDLTQGFFVHLLEKGGLGRADPELGRFRTFLLASLKNFLANESAKGHALKRGGGQTILRFDGEDAEAHYRLEPSHDMTAERHFERQWAVTLLDQVLSAIRVEYFNAGNGDLFEELKNVLIGHSEPYADISAAVGAKRRGDQGGRPSASPALSPVDASTSCRNGRRRGSGGRSVRQLSAALSR